MTRLVSALALAALLLAGTLSPSFASAGPQTSHMHGMCVRGVQGACNPGLPGWNDGKNRGRRWICHPLMPPQGLGHARSHAWVCSWTPVHTPTH